LESTLATDKVEYMMNDLMKTTPLHLSCQIYWKKFFNKHQH